MILQVFCIFDSAVGVYDNPVYLHSIGEAKRAFIEVSRDTNTKIAKHPSDHSLFHLGQYDTQSALHTNLPAPVRLMLATEAIST